MSHAPPFASVPACVVATAGRVALAALAAFAASGAFVACGARPSGGAAECTSGPEPSTDPGGPEAAPGFAARLWFSSETRPFRLEAPDPAWFGCPLAIQYKLAPQRDLPITAPGGPAAVRIDVDPSVTFQAVLGIGVSLEESSVRNILALSSAKRAEILTRLFDPVRGMGQNLVRVTMGTSDFTGRPWYTYDDLPPGLEDPKMDHFSIQKDIDFGIIDVLKEALAINPGIRFFASPWSPPAWMKTTGVITGGGLLSQNIPALARYFRKFVEAYRDQGIPIHAVTLQNEPRIDSPHMPACLVDADQEALLVKAIKSEFAAGNLDTRAWVLDHNFDIGVPFAQTLFGDIGALAATDAVAFHDYAGDPSAMTALHDLYPGKDVVFTEKALWGVAGVDRAAQYFRNWSRTYVSWVTMLDQDAEPNRGPNSWKPRRFIRSITYRGDEYYATPEHYLFGLYSKFVLPGARRISSPYGSKATVTDVAFLDPDGTVIVVVVNQTSDRQEFALVSEGNQVWAALDAKTAATYVWRAGLGRSSLPPTAPTN